MSFQNEEAKLNAGNISNSERLVILHELGKIAQGKYDDFIISGGTARGYKLYPLKGSLQYQPNMSSFDNEYWLQGTDDHWTKVAIWFEYGTGLYNQKRAGRYRAGYIKPVIKDYMTFVAKDGKFVKTDRVKGVHPILAMTKAIKYVEFNRKHLQKEIRLRLQNGRRIY